MRLGLPFLVNNYYSIVLLNFIALTAFRYVFKTAYYNFVAFKITKNVTLIYGYWRIRNLNQNALTSHSVAFLKVVGYMGDKG